MVDIATLENRIDEVEAAFNRARQGLRRADGAPVYSDAETEEREAAAFRTFRQELARIGDALDAVVQEAEDTIEGIENADLTDSFSTDELQRISVRTPFLLEDLRRLPTDARLARLR